MGAHESRPLRRHKHLRKKDGILGIRQREFVVVSGQPLDYAAETNADPERIDHFWISIEAGKAGSLRIALNTYSRKQAQAGFNPHLRVGVVRSEWTQLPAAGICQAGPFNYHDIEASQLVTYEEHDRDALVRLLLEKTTRATFIEAWGELYLHNHLGIHQVHSRRASLSIRTDYIGRDGAIRFYFAGTFTAEMLLFKFFGQP